MPCALIEESISCCSCYNPISILYRQDSSLSSKEISIRVQSLVLRLAALGRVSLDRRFGRLCRSLSSSGGGLAGSLGWGFTSLWARSSWEAVVIWQSSHSGEDAVQTQGWEVGHTTGWSDPISEVGRGLCTGFSDSPCAFNDGVDLGTTRDELSSTLDNQIGSVQKDCAQNLVELCQTLNHDATNDLTKCNGS